MKYAVVLYGDLFKQFLKINSGQLTLTGLHKKIFTRIMGNEIIEELGDLITFFSDYTSLLKHLMFRRYSGSEKAPGILDALLKKKYQVCFLHRDNFIKDHEKLLEKYQPIILIAPLEATEDLELRKICFGIKIPMFPMINPKMESKYITRKLFANIVLPFSKINPKQLSSTLDKSELGESMYFNWDQTRFGSLLSSRMTWDLALARQFHTKLPPCT